MKATQAIRAMPQDSAERQAALEIMDWAYHDPEASAADPEGAKAYREFCDTASFGNDDALWRRAYDMALSVWRKGHEHYQAEKAKALELF